MELNSIYLMIKWVLPNDWIFNKRYFYQTTKYDILLDSVQYVFKYSREME